MFLEVLGVAANREGAAVEKFKAVRRRARPEAGSTFISSGWPGNYTSLGTADSARSHFHLELLL